MIFRRALCAILTCILLSGPSFARADTPDPLGDLIQSALTVPSEAAAWLMRATLYHAGALGVGTKDALGCRPVPMRTAAVDRTIAPLGAKLFIPETVGIPLPQGGQHDGVWYASDTGSAIRGQRIDLYTGLGARSMEGLRHLNLTKLSVAKVGAFTGCPPA